MNGEGPDRRRIEERLEKVEETMSVHGTRIALLEKDQPTIKELAEEVRNIGQTVIKFITIHETTEELNKKVENQKHEENKKLLNQQNTKANIVMAICAIATLILGIMGFIYAVEVKNHSEMDPAKIFHAFVQDMELSSLQRQELSSDPSLRKSR